MVGKDLHVIVGLGATGLSCARYLSKQNLPFAVVDTRSAPPYLTELKKIRPEVEISLGSLDSKLFQNAAKIILSPGIAKSEPSIVEQAKRGVPILGDIELFAKAVKAPVIGITGTNAKSTVTTLVAEMAAASDLKSAAGGNLGVPALDLLQENQSVDCYVLELSSFQLETTYSLQPRVATVLNITPDHMDRYKDFSEYQQTKLRIYHNCSVAVSNLDDPLTEYQADRKFYFSLKETRDSCFGLLNKSNNLFLAYENKPLIAVEELLVKGRHYQANALAALAIGHGFGMETAIMLNVLRTFAGLPHRCQLIRELHQVKWYNDSKGTNVGATLAAIEGLGSEMQGQIVLIAGGLGKSADFTPLLPMVKKYCRCVVLIGEAANDIDNVLHNEVVSIYAKDMQEAVNIAADKAQACDSVLLSPACASFDMFNGYVHRGDVFTKLVNEL